MKFSIKTTLLLVATGILLNSCASVFNSRYTGVTVHTTAPSRINSGDTTVGTINNKAYLRLERSNQLTNIRIEADSFSKAIRLRPRNSGMFYINIPYNLGLGMLLDLNSPKRWGFPRHIYVDVADTTSQYFSAPPNQGWYLYLSLPFINNFRFEPQNQFITKTRSGFFGFSLGLEYFYRKNASFRFTGSAISAHPFFIPFPIRREGAFETVGSAYLALTHHHLLSKWSFGYGLTHGEDVWIREMAIVATPEDPFAIDQTAFNKRNAFWGLAFPLYYRFNRLFYLGLIYRPTILRIGVTPSINYEHAISLDFAWKIRLSKNSNW